MDMLTTLAILEALGIAMTAICGFAAIFFGWQVRQDRGGHTWSSIPLGAFLFVLGLAWCVCFWVFGPLFGKAFIGFFGELP